MQLCKQDKALTFPSTQSQWRDRFLTAWINTGMQARKDQNLHHQLIISDCLLFIGKVLLLVTLLGTHITKMLTIMLLHLRVPLEQKKKPLEDDSHVQNCILWSRENYWETRNTYEYYPPGTTHIYVYIRNFFTILKNRLSFYERKKNTGMHCRTKREFEMENTMKKFEVKALIGITWEYVGERILRNIFS